MLTYKSLYSLVNEQIKRRINYNTNAPYSSGSQTSRKEVQPTIMAGSGRREVSANELIEAMQALLDDALPNNIVEGLEVVATTPVSNSITISAGKGTAGGVMYILDEDVTIEVPFDSETEVFYVTLYKDMIRFDKKEDNKRLKLAKIVIPNPGVTNTVKNRREDDYPWDAYIVNFHKYDLYGIYDTFEEDTVDLLRDNIGAILADNLIGNIRLSENMTITNTASTLLLDSNSVKIKDASGNVIAKFDKNGTFFYDSSGIELAKFGADSARVGNIIIEKDNIHSGNYVSEISGFKIQDNGFAEFDNVRVRGRISSTVFEYGKVSGVGGSLFVGNASVLASDMTILDASTLTVEDNVFSVNEVLKIKEGSDEEYLLVTNISSAPTYIVTRDLANTYTSDNNPAWKTGVAIISQGKGDPSALGGYLLLDSISQYSPFLDIVYRHSATYNDISTKVRVGNLQGITDADFGGALNGFGVYATNVYLKGELYAPTIKTAYTDARIELTADGLIMYDDEDNKKLAAYLKGDYAGDVVIGNKSSNKYVEWDESTGELTVRGLLNADDIVAGTISAERLNVSQLDAITTNTGTLSIDESMTAGANIIIDGVNEVIKVFGDEQTITTGLNDKIDWIEDSTTYVATLTADDYTPAELATEVQTEMRAISSTNIEVTYNTTTKKITIANDEDVNLHLLWSTGANSTTTCGKVLGFDVTANDTGALTYTADYQIALRVELGLLS